LVPVVVSGGVARDPEVGWQLVDVARDLARAHTIDDVVEVVRVAARRLTGADGATFVLREGDRCHYVDEDAIAPLWKGRTFALDECISGWAMLHDSAVVIEDIYADDRIPHDAYRPTFVRSLVMVPVRTTKSVAAIGAYWAARRDPSPEQVEVLQALADSTAVALDNARLYAELEARVADRTAELARANDELQELAATVAHDLRSPLTSVLGFASVLATHHAAELSAEARLVVDALERSTEGLRHFVNDLLEYLTAGARDPEVTVIDLDRLLAEVLDRLRVDVEARQAVVHRVGASRLEGDPMMVGQAVQNLVANSLVHVPSDRSPVITVGVTRVDGYWELAVTDNGDGIPVAEREAIFEPFRRGTHARAGHGLGLAVCRRIAEQHRGEVVVTDGPGGGACFVLRLADIG
jgi:signal transduction histidine kinase